MTWRVWPRCCLPGTPASSRSEDYCAATGVQRTRDRRSLLYPRAQLATTAKAYGVQAIDMVCIDYKDTRYLLDECEDGAQLGFDGKQAIHPAQLPYLQRAFSPSDKGTPPRSHSRPRRAAHLGRVP